MTYEEALFYLRNGPIGEVGYTYRPVKVEVLNAAIEAMEKIIKQNADGCVDCAFTDVEEWEMPCAKCKRNSKDYWRQKVK